jgi:hypothetical protein
VVPTISDLAPLDLAVRFQDAAKSVGQTITVKEYAPVPLAAKDPFGLVQALMLLPQLIGGYMSSTLLMAATGKAAGCWRLATLAGFAIVAGLVVDLMVCYLTGDHSRPSASVSQNAISYACKARAARTASCGSSPAASPAATTDVACSAKPGAGSAKNRKNPTACSARP